MDHIRFRGTANVLKSALLTFGLVVAASAIANSRIALAADSSQFNVTGVWRVDIKQNRRRCQWQGQVHLDQTGTKLTGSGEAAASQAKRFCPRLKGDVEGSVNGAQVKFGFATGRLGIGEFDGALVDGGRMLSGTWSAGSAAGTWQAERLD